MTENGESMVSSVPLSNLSIWDKMKKKRALFTFDLEVTARCNNDCRHCYINLPVSDATAKTNEMSLEEIDRIADEAASLGAFWCLITGGEPLLREDFFDIYLCLKKKGILVTVFTNAVLITEEHVKFFKKYPPRNMEVTVYGVTRETYGRVTRRPGSFDAFMRGLDLLLDNGIKVRLKTMALRSNLAEMPEIARFCWERTKDYFRFDPLIHLRFDGDPKKNQDIKSERLLPSEIVALEQAETKRFLEMQRECDELIIPELSKAKTDLIFTCDAGKNRCTIGYNGFFRLCPSLYHPDCVFDLRKGSLVDAWWNFVPKVVSMRSNREEFLKKCRICPIVNLCLWCPAHSHLETGVLDMPVDYFCAVAHARAEALEKAVSSQHS